MKCRVLVAGGGNQVAGFLIPDLLRAGHQVIVHSRRPPPPWLQPHPALDWGTGSLELAGPRAAGCEALVYLAPLDQFAELWQGLTGVSRVVAFSSTSRVAKAASDDPAERKLAATLAAGEAQLHRLSEPAGAALAVLRPTLIYGAGIDQNLTRLAGFIRRWRVMPLLGAGSGKRQPVHAADLAAAAMKLLQRDQPVAGSYDLAGGSTLSYRLMVEKIFESLRIKPRFLPVPLPAARAALPLLRRSERWRDLNLAMLNRMNKDLAFDCSPAQRDFDYQPRPFRPQPNTWLPLDQQKGP